MGRKKIRKLNLEDAYKLYLILSPHTPRTQPDDPLDFMHQIVKSCKISGRNVDFVDSLKILTGLSLGELGKIEGMELIELFTDGLIENNFVTLIYFFDEIKHGR